MLVGRLRWTPILWNRRGTLLWFILVSCIAVAWHLTIHEAGWFRMLEPLPFPMRRAVRWLEPEISPGLVGALGGALAIFVAFRNHSAHDRWWEARKAWGALVSDSRSWCRQCLAWIRVESGSGATDVPAFRRELVHRHLAFVHGLARHLREQEGLVDAIEGFVAPDESDYYRGVPNVPAAVLLRQGVRVAELRSAGVVEHFRHLQMDQLLTRLTDLQGRCEQIKNTPLPRLYAQIPRTFAVVYGTLLPFGLAATLEWWAIPVSILVATLFVLFEESGRVLEAPFDHGPMDVPMSALALTIERDLRAALEEPRPDPAAPDRRGVLM